MGVQRHQRVMELFDAAIQLDETERTTFLASACGDDKRMREDIESLLLHHRSETIIAGPAVKSTIAEGSAQPRTSKISAPANGARQNARAWRPIAIAALIFALVLSWVGWWVHDRIKQSLRQSVARQLTTVLDANVVALEYWIAFEKAAVESWAQNENVKRHIQQLVEIDRRTHSSHDELVQSPAFHELQRLLEPVDDRGENYGFTVVSRDGVKVASDEEDRLGVEVSPAGGSYLRRLVLGETILLLPSPKNMFVAGFESDINDPVMGVAAPVRDQDQRIIAGLAFGFPADDEFTRILSSAKLGDTGETYVFNESGLLLSNLRDIPTLHKIGLVPDGSEHQSALRVQIRDPGGDLAAGFAPQRALPEWPLTRMAASATAGNSGSDLIGYRNYRGATVVGAWRWFANYGFGVASEITKTDAYAPLRYVSWAFGVLTVALVTFGFVALFSSLVALRLGRQVGEIRQLGEYTLERLIGEGGMGKVYRARHAFLRRPAAIKLLVGKEADRETVARFEREVQITSTLSHPNTIQIYDYGRTPDDVFYYVMELLPGLNLAELVATGGPLPCSRVLHILRQICGSLKEAHDRGMVHRDIKPANIMICERGGMYDVVKVLDFGLAKSTFSGSEMDITQGQVLSGTPLFIAPEQIRDPTVLDVRTDVYALGAVTFYLLTGQHVFDGHGAPDLFHHALNTPPRRPSESTDNDLPLEMDHLILDCLAKQPDGRPANIDEVMQVVTTLSKRFNWEQADARRWWDSKSAQVDAYKTAAS